MSHASCSRIWDLSATQVVPGWIQAQLGKLDVAVVTEQATAILLELKKLGEKLDAKEEAFLASQVSGGSSLADFVAVSESAEVTSIPAAR